MNEAYNRPPDALPQLTFRRWRRIEPVFSSEDEVALKQRLGRSVLIGSKGTLGNSEQPEPGLARAAGDASSQDERVLP